MRLALTCALLALALGAAACGDGGGSSPPASPGDGTTGAEAAVATATSPEATPAPAPATPEPAPAAPAPVASTTVEFGWDGVEQDGEVPARFTCDGDDVSPPLVWGNLPERAVEVVVIAADRDRNNLTHWLAYGIPAAAGALPEGLPRKKLVTGPPALRQGLNDLEVNGWSGPCPPKGEEHTYVFLFFALKGSVEIPGGADRNTVEEALAPLVVANAALEVRYRRG